jgi:hypothetical protein
VITQIIRDTASDWMRTGDAINKADMNNGLLLKKCNLYPILLNC